MGTWCPARAPPPLLSHYRIFIKTLHLGRSALIRWESPPRASWLPLNLSPAPYSCSTYPPVLPYSTLSAILGQVQSHNIEPVWTGEGWRRISEITEGRRQRVCRQREKKIKLGKNDGAALRWRLRRIVMWRKQRDFHRRVSGAQFPVVVRR